MSGSPESTRTRLIREMARDMNKLRNASGSAAGSFRGSKADTNSTASSFDPDNEAIVSTRNLDPPSRVLPELRDSAKKYRNFRLPQPDVHIDTSAIHRAFPDFTQGSRSFEESLSVEIGRGDPARGAVEANSSLMDFGAGDIERDVPKNGDHVVKGAPQRATSSYNRDAGYSLAPDSENNTFTSHSAQPAPSGFINTKDLVHRLGKVAPNLRKHSDAAHSQPKSEPVKHYSADITDMPNLSELISGVYEDGTPIFSGISPKNSSLPAKYGRKTKLSHVELASIPTPDDEQAIYISLKLLQEKVAALESSKVEDAAAIATLRAENEALAREKYESQRSKRSDSALGSTSGSDAGDESGQGARRATIQKARLESRLQRIQEELRVANSKCQISAETIQNISHERDAATNQLGVAYLTTERLKAEVKALKSENEQLRTELESFIEANQHRYPTSADTDKTSSQTQAEKTAAYRASEVEDQDHTQMFNFDINYASGSHVPAQEVAASGVVHRPGAQPNGHPQPQSQPRLKSHIRKVPSDKSINLVTGAAGFPGATTNQPHNHLETGNVDRPAKIAPNAADEDAPVGSKAAAAVRRLPRDQPPPIRQAEINLNALHDDMTILSEERGYRDEIFPEIRAMLEDARRARKNHRVSYELPLGSVPQARTNTAMMDDLAALSQRSRHESRKRRSMPTYSAARGEQTDLTGLSDGFPHIAHRSDDSLLKQSSQRNGFAMEEMTSAYIVPDITLHRPDATDQPRAPYISQPEITTEHDLGFNEILRDTTGHGNSQERKHNKISIPKPVPVSERAPSPTPSNPDPTMRPSEKPGLSLARVIKSLNDEISAIKNSLKALEVASYQHDPALSKRQRVERERQITVLRKSKNSKSDQVYYLMNVLEGQKLAGQEMTESQIEVTLQSAGMDISQIEQQLDSAEDEDPALDESIAVDEDFSDFNPMDSSPPTLSRLPESVSAQRLPSRAAAQPMKPALERPTKHPWDDLDDTEDLPWEGFESTGNITGRSHRSSDSQHNRRVSQ